jgi:hypothetical protein
MPASTIQSILGKKESLGDQNRIRSAENYTKKTKQFFE